MAADAQAAWPGPELPAPPAAHDEAQIVARLPGGHARPDSPGRDEADSRGDPLAGRVARRDAQSSHAALPLMQWPVGGQPHGLGGITAVLAVRTTP